MTNRNMETERINKENQSNNNIRHDDTANSPIQIGMLNNRKQDQIRILTAEMSFAYGRSQEFLDQATANKHRS